MVRKHFPNHSPANRATSSRAPGFAKRCVAPGTITSLFSPGSRSKALRRAIDCVYGSDNPVQRCRNHKLKNVVDHLPNDLKDQASSAMRAAFKGGVPGLVETMSHPPGSLISTSTIMRPVPSPQGTYC